MAELWSNLDIIIVSGLLILGASLMLLASVGLLRLPDLPTRMHASTKAGTLGAALTMLAVAVFIPEPAVIARSMAVIAFLLLTAPVAAHVIGRAGYFVGVPLWEGTIKDDLAAQYDFETHVLHSGDHDHKSLEEVRAAAKEARVAQDAADEVSEAVEESEEVDEEPEEVDEEPDEVDEEAEEVDEEAEEVVASSKDKKKDKDRREVEAAEPEEV